MKRNNYVWYLSALVPLAIIIHIFLALEGISVGWHPDEWRITLETLAMASSKSLFPPSINYPLFFRYLLLILYGVWFAVGYLLRFFHSSLDFALLFFDKEQLFLLVPRITNVLLGGVTIYASYLVAKKYFDEKTAIVAAIFSSIEYQLFVQSQVGLHQTIAALSTLPIFYLLKSYLYTPTINNLYLLSFFVGIGASIHHTTILFIPLILFVLFYNLNRLPFLKNLTSYLAATLIGLSASVLGNLQWIFKFKESLAFLRLGEDVSKIAFSSNQYFQYTIPSFIWWLFQELTRQDYLLGAVMFLSCFTYLIRREKKYLIILIFFVTYILYFYGWAYRWLHILIGIIPIMTIYAADLVVAVSSKVSQKYALFVFVVLITVPSLFSIMSLTFERQKTDTREAAVEWIMENIATTDKIAIDWSSYSPMIPATPPIYLINPNGKQFYYHQLPEEIQNTLSRSQPNYTIVESIFQTPEPIWPTNMSVEEINKAKSYSIYNNLYSYFNFIPTKELSNKFESNYLVITSYTYTMFLYDDSPYKTNLFNIYEKDNMLAYQSHTKSKSLNERHRLLSYLVDRAQEFYIPLLENQDRYYREIKRFSPGDGLSGPEVVIFKKRQ